MDGKEYLFVDFVDCEVMVVIFICNSCFYVVDYEDWFIELCEKYLIEKVGLIVINVN